MMSRWVFAAGSLAVIGTATILIATRSWGMGISTDSVVYLSTAESLLGGDGYVIRMTSEPLTHWPPLYPTGIAALSLLAGIDPITAARFLNAGLFGINIFLVGALVWLGTASGALVVIASLMMLLSTHMLQIHWMAWSEPLFVTLMLTTILVLRDSLARLRMPLAAAVVAGGAALTRYLGVVLSGVGALSFVVLASGESGARIRRASLFMIVALLPVALWIIRNLALIGSVGGGADVTFYASAVARLRSGPDVVLTWFMPERIVSLLPPQFHAVSTLMAVGAVAGLVVLAVVGGRPAAPVLSQQRLGVPLALFVVGYVLLFAILVFTAVPSSRLDQRYLAPTFPAVVILSMIAIQRHGSRLKDRRPLRLSLLSILGVVLLSYAARAALFSATMYREGQLFSSRVWRSSPTMAQVKRLPPGTIIYSNAYPAVYYLAGVAARPIPAKWQIDSQQPHPDYPRVIRSIGEVLRTTDSVVVVFDIGRSSKSTNLRADLEADLPLMPIYEGPDGSILMLKGK